MRWIVGWLLLVAAVLKAVLFVTEPAVTHVGPFDGRFLPVEIGVELCFGLVALSGIYWQLFRWIALLLFTTFAVHSLTLTSNGAASCGCFGILEIHPWWSLALDLAISTGLLLSICHGHTVREVRENLSVSVLARQRLISAVILGISVLTIAILFRYAVVRSPSLGVGNQARTRDFEIVEPEKWVGKPFVLSQLIDLDVSHGNWTILLYRHDCPECQSAVSKYVELAAGSTDTRFALIEVPPFSRQDEIIGGNCYRSHLRNDRDWFIVTPMEIRLVNGIVSAASMDVTPL